MQTSSATSQLPPAPPDSIHRSAPHVSWLLLRRWQVPRTSEFSSRRVILQSPGLSGRSLVRSGTRRSDPRPTPRHSPISRSVRAEPGQIRHSTLGSPPSTATSWFSRRSPDATLPAGSFFFHRPSLFRVWKKNGLCVKRNVFFSLCGGRVCNFDKNYGQ
jgi:hypothetical protein